MIDSILMKKILLVKLTLLLFSCSNINSDEHPKEPISKLTDEEVVEKYLKNGAWQQRIFSPEYQQYIDSAIAVKPEMAYLYQQKAMPFFKQRKYEAGMKILDKAVELDAKRFLDYRAFIKCVFAKTYHDAILDFREAKNLISKDGYIMDHSYDFYIGLCYIQLNEFEKAAEIIRESIEKLVEEKGEEWVHHLDYFYLGIAFHELQQHEEAIKYFDKTLKKYKEFSDAEYYKAISLYRSGKVDLAVELLSMCEQHFNMGYTINEANAIYEEYPYQISMKHIDVLKR